MMRNTDAMIEAARESGRVGYQRAAAKILADTPGLRVARFVARWLHIHQPYADALADRFELLMCRRVVLHQLLDFADTSLTPLLGERLARLLGTILRTRIEKAERGLDNVRQCFGQHGADVLERRMMLLYALREGRARVAAMYEDRSISKEIYDSIRRELDAAWKRAVPRAHPDVLLADLEGAEAPADARANASADPGADAQAGAHAHAAPMPEVQGRFAPVSTKTGSATTEAADAAESAANDAQRGTAP